MAYKPVQLIRKHSAGCCMMNGTDVALFGMEDGGGVLRTRESSEIMTPPPGSTEAKERGCTCPTLATDNRGLARLLAVLGNELHRSNFVGNPSQSVDERYKRMVAPKPGDLVMETSSGAWRFGNNGNYRTKPETAVGILRDILREEVAFDEPWDEVAEGRPCPTEEVFYITAIDGTQRMRWTNASFITIIPKEGWGGTSPNPCLWDTLRQLIDWD